MEVIMSFSKVYSFYKCACIQMRKHNLLGYLLLMLTIKCLVISFRSQIVAGRA
jgi:hypothetical protein